MKQPRNPVATVTEDIYRLPDTPLPTPGPYPRQILLTANAEEASPNWYVIRSVCRMQDGKRVYEWYDNDWRVNIYYLNSQRFYWMFAPSGTQVAWKTAD